MSDMQYINILDDDNVLHFRMSTVHFCRLDTALHPADRVQDCSFLLENDKEKIKEYGQISMLNKTIDQAISICKNCWAITALSPRKLYVTCLTFFCPYNLRHPFDIIYLPNSCEVTSNSFPLPSNEHLISEVDSKNLNIKFINFERRYSYYC